MDSPVYRARQPRKSPLWQCLFNHYAFFKLHYEERFQKVHGYFREVVDEVVEKYLECGDLSKGFARIGACGCGHELLLAFSCKCRWFCPSCHQKKVLLFGEQVVNEIAFPVPHRQYVFTIPKRLRVYFRGKPKLQGGLCLVARDSLKMFLREQLNLPHGDVGMITVLQTFGEYLGWHPHVHALCGDGLFVAGGLFYCMPSCELVRLEALFQAGVLKLLLRAGLIDEDTVENMLGWEHSGFGIDNGKVIAKGDQAGLERVAQYILRNPFSLAKMTYNPDTETVLYRSKRDYHSKCNFKVFTAEAFIASITQHIPERHFQNVRYYGWYSNKARGQRRKAHNLAEEASAAGSAVEGIDVSKHKPKKRPTKKWRELIKKVWEAEPLLCPRCGQAMKVIAFIDEPVAIYEILSYLGLWAPVNEMTRPRAPPRTKCREAYTYPGEPDQYALVYEGQSSDGIDELPQDDTPVYVYD